LVFSWLTEQNMTSNYIAQDVKTTWSSITTLTSMPTSSQEDILPLLLDPKILERKPAHRCMYTHNHMHREPASSSGRLLSITGSTCRCPEAVFWFLFLPMGDLMSLQCWTRCTLAISAQFNVPPE
jgi:hypothetical protein